MERICATVAKGVGDAGRCLFREGRAVNGMRYRAWLKDMGFAEGAGELEAIVSAPSLARASGHLRPKEYQAWAEEHVVSPLRALLKRQERFEGSTLTLLDPKASELANELLGYVLVRFREWTEAIYRHSELEGPRFLEGLGPIAPLAGEKRPWQALVRRLRRRAGA